MATNEAYRSHPAHAGLIAGFAGILLLPAAAMAQSAPDTGVFISQIGDGNRAAVTQQTSDGAARIAQNGTTTPPPSPSRAALRIRQISRSRATPIA
jgi:hypothetical protein